MSADEKRNPSERDTWDRHWQALEGESALFGTLASWVRRFVLRRAVRGYAERFFPADGIFVETGCGTAQASTGIPLRGRRLVGFDFSLPALRTARATGSHRDVLGGDIRRLPFRDGSVSGIWNLGVMEHFQPEEGVAILREFGRVLRPGGTAVLFWPPSFGSSRWVLAPIEWVRSRVSGRPFHFFPDEVNRLTSRRHARETVRSSGLDPVAVEFSPRDGFIHMVVVARKP